MYTFTITREEISSPKAEIDDNQKFPVLIKFNETSIVLRKEELDLLIPQLVEIQIELERREKEAEREWRAS